jgi:hypothetical protein
VTEQDLKLLQGNRFLEKLRINALATRDQKVPYGEPDLWVPSRWLTAVIQTLEQHGYEIKGKSETK